MLKKRDLLGMNYEKAIDTIYHDIDYSGMTKFSWLLVSDNENRQSFIRFPYGTDLYIEHNNGIITLVK